MLAAWHSLAEPLLSADLLLVIALEKLLVRDELPARSAVCLKLLILLLLVGVMMIVMLICIFFNI